MAFCPTVAPRSARSGIAAAALTVPLMLSAAAPAAGPTYPDGALGQAVGQLVVLDRAFRLCLPSMVDRYESMIAAEKVNGLLDIEPYASQFDALSGSPQSLDRQIRCTQMDQTAALLARSPDHLLSFIFRNSACVMTGLQALPRSEELDQETRRRVVEIGESCAHRSAEAALTDPIYRPAAAGPSPHRPGFSPPAPPAPATDSPATLSRDTASPPPRPSTSDQVAQPERKRLVLPPSLDELPAPGGVAPTTTTMTPPPATSAYPAPATEADPLPAPSAAAARPAPAARLPAGPTATAGPGSSRTSTPVSRDSPSRVTGPSRPAFRRAPPADPFARDRSLSAPPSRGCQFC